MPIAIVTGSGGPHRLGVRPPLRRARFDVIGVENDMRAYFFGPEASTSPSSRRLVEEVDGFLRTELDIRDADGVMDLFARHARDLAVVIHTAAQPSHDWAASEPHTDFSVNATGTLNLLQAARTHAPDATFIFTSTNKVYGDRPNALPLVEHETRLELPEDHRWYGGIDLEMPIDQWTHSLFGVSKAAADCWSRSTGATFRCRRVCFRGGCLTGP
jgi:CDP-paratose 2-epimerase